MLNHQIYINSLDKPPGLVICINCKQKQVNFILWLVSRSACECIDIILDSDVCWS